MDGITYASSILTRAVTFDTNGRYTESLVCYQEGLQILMEALKSVEEEVKRVKLRDKVQEYMSRAEKVKNHIENLKSTGKFREQIQVEENAVGFSYHSVFARFLDHSITAIEVDDPYIRSPHQCDNFLRFLEMSLQQCSKLSIMKLTTTRDQKHDEQCKRLEDMRKSAQRFQGRNVQLVTNFSDSLHDREIRLDNGYVIKIGRGLDYFKPVDRHTIGWSNFDLRPCRETTIDIFHKNELRKCH